jgi:lysozyme family protein
MINKYSDFILDKKFDSIVNEMFLIIESKEGKWLDNKTIVWDYREKPEKGNSNIFEWDLTKTDSTKEKLRKFLSNLPKEKIKQYFFKLISKLKKFPKKLKKKMLLTYSAIFLSFVPLDYLTKDIVDSNIFDDIEIVRSIESELSNRKSRFSLAQGIVKEVEAGYSGDRKDRGNFLKTPYGKRFLGTNHGISAPILADYLGRIPNEEDMKNLSYETALEIFKNQYWDPQNINEFKDQNIANIIYDGCVNQGISGMKKILRKVYNDNNIKISEQENPFSIDFITKANDLDQKDLFHNIKSERENRYRSSITFKTHGKGWLSRLSKFDYDDDKNL